MKDIRAIATLVDHSNDSTNLALNTSESIARGLQFGWFDNHVAPLSCVSLNRSIP